MLIYFIHHASESIQAEHLIASVAAEFSATMKRLFPEKLGESVGEENGEQDAPDIPELTQTGLGRSWRTAAAISRQ